MGWEIVALIPVWAVPSSGAKPTLQPSPWGLTAPCLPYTWNENQMTRDGVVGSWDSSSLTWLQRCQTPCLSSICLSEAEIKQRGEVLEWARSWWSRMHGCHLSWRAEVCPPQDSGPLWQTVSHWYDQWLPGLPSHKSSSFLSSKPGMYFNPVAPNLAPEHGTSNIYWLNEGINKYKCMSVWQRGGRTPWWVVRTTDFSVRNRSGLGSWLWPFLAV